MDYFLRHWRGELSLSLSFWVNNAVFNAFIGVAGALLADQSLIEHPVKAAQVNLVTIAFLWLIIYPWQIVGLWRSANRRINTNDRILWPRVCQILVILGLVINSVGFARDYPFYKYLYDLSFKADEKDEFTVALDPKNNVIRIDGALRFGISEEIERLVKQNKSIRAIVLNSAGGRIYEGREISRIVSENGLKVFTTEKCFSACTLAFMAGSERYIAKEANLGFHQYSTGADALNEFVSSELAYEQQRDMDFYRSQGIEETFIQKIFKTPPEEMWTPSKGELWQAGVIHGYVSAANLAVTGFMADARNSLSRGLLNRPFFEIIRLHDSDAYGALVMDITNKIGAGLSDAAIDDTVGRHVKALLEESLPITSDKALIAFTHQTVTVLRTLNRKAPRLCMKFLFPESFGVLDITAHISEDMVDSLDQSMEQVIRDRYEKSNPRVDAAKAEIALGIIATNMGEDVLALEVLPPNNGAGFAEYCSAAINLYEIVLQQDIDVTSNVLRYMYTP